MPFELAYTLHGGDAHKLTLAIKSGAAVVAGTLVNIESGEADVAATNDTALAGVCTGVDSVTGLAAVVVDPAAVYRVEDASARAVGATLDIGSGGRTVASSSNIDLVVAGKSPAGAPTLVKISSANHAFNK
jgi:hypothetical protein